jgi:hypothetical protein
MVLVFHRSTCTDRGAAVAAKVLDSTKASTTATTTNNDDNGILSVPLRSIFPAIPEAPAVFVVDRLGNEIRTHVLPNRFGVTVATVPSCS